MPPGSLPRNSVITLVAGNVSTTFLFGFMGVWLEPYVAKLLLKCFVQVVESLCWNQPIANVIKTFDY